ncbi:MAG: helix-turn-helix domain-containing protein [Leptospira sp.]|nr:helix-turn-helix domain-containing protein [Leptospira sp.]
MFDPFLLIIFAGMVTSLLGLLGAILDSHSFWEKLATGVLFFAVGLVQFSYYIWFLGIEGNYLFLHSIDLPFACTIGPLLYIYLQIIIRTNTNISKRYFLPFIPAILALIIIIPYSFLSDEEKKIIIENIDEGKLEFGYSFLISLIRYVVFIQTIIYLLHFIIKLRPIVNLKSFKREEVTFHIFIILTTCIVTLSVGLITTIFLNHEYLVLSHKLISVMISFLLIYLHIIVRKFPQSAKRVQKEFQKIKYENSNLKNVNLQKIQEKLNRLLDEDKIYEDHDISMDKLAEMLGIGGHKLSQYLNEILKTNFYDFINHYRIIESEKILLNEPQRTVLSIALEVGFSSQSTFYSAFRKKWKMSPNIFRKKFSKK